jgi:hypothetical protein
MGIQSTLNNQAINMLPKTSKFIKTLNNQERDNAIAITLRRINNSITALCDMYDKQLSLFDADTLRLCNDKRLAEFK